jgi:hypothetical protein
MLRWVARRALVGILSTCVAGSAMAADQPWRDASQPPGQRADEAAGGDDPRPEGGDGARRPGLAGRPRRPDASLRRRAQRHPRGRHDVAASAQTLAATFDRSLARAYGEPWGPRRAAGLQLVAGPAMDIAHALAGRQPETWARTPSTWPARRWPRRSPAPRAPTSSRRSSTTSPTTRSGAASGSTRRPGAAAASAPRLERALQNLRAPFKRAIRSPRPTR